MGIHSCKYVAPVPRHHATPSAEAPAVQSFPGRHISFWSSRSDPISPGWVVPACGAAMSEQPLCVTTSFVIFLHSPVL